MYIIIDVGALLDINVKNVTEGDSFLVCVNVSAISQRNISIELNITQVSSTGMTCVQT